MNRTRNHARRARIATALGAILATAGITLAACSSSGSQSAVDASNDTAQIEYNEFTSIVPYPYTKCDTGGVNCVAQPPATSLERTNIAKRLKQYNQANSTNYVYIFDFAGHVLGYYVIQGKVSSTGSEMTSTQQVTNCGNQGGCAVTDAIGDDGTYGPEEGGQFGVFFYTAAGTLVETDQPFLVSSTPIKLYANVPQLDAAAK